MQPAQSDHGSAGTPHGPKLNNAKEVTACKHIVAVWASLLKHKGIMKSLTERGDFSVPDEEGRKGEEKTRGERKGEEKKRPSSSRVH